MFIENVQHAWSPLKYTKLCFYILYFQQTLQERCFVGYQKNTDVVHALCSHPPFSLSVCLTESSHIPIQLCF